MRCAKIAITFAFLLSGFSLWFTSPVTLAAPNEQAAKKTPIVIKGQVYCLNSNGQRRNADQDCLPSAATYEVKASDGKVYRFSANDLLVTMFAESRVRRMDLQISGVLRDPNLLELVKIQALKDNKVFDIYYFCEVCNITAYGPGPCPCCYEPFVFIEKPAMDK